jgi:hypothetical protein
MTDAQKPCDYDEGGACQTHPGGAASWCDKAPSPKLELPQEVRTALACPYCAIGHCDEVVIHRGDLAAFIRRIAGEGKRG